MKDFKHNSESKKSKQRSKYIENEDNINKQSFIQNEKIELQISLTDHSLNLRKKSHPLLQRSLSKNRNLKYLFHNFSKQIYNGGGKTFDLIAESAQFMNMSKWMIFCREFELTEHLHPRRLSEIFMEATQKSPLMSYEYFLKGLQIFQERSKIGETTLSRHLHIESLESVKNRLKAVKIHFNGPKINYFIEARLTQKQREESKYEFKKHQYVLHQGMSHEHLQSELQRRKKLREQRRSNLFHSSIAGQNENTQKTYQTKISIRRKSYFESYSQIYKMRKYSRQGRKDSKVKKLPQIKDRRMNNHSHVIYFIENDKMEDLFETRQVRHKQYQNPEKNEIDIKQVIDVSDTESDEILNQHFRQQEQPERRRYH